MIHMHKRAGVYPSRLSLCGVELAERNAPRFLTTADKHVSCKRCRRLLAPIERDDPNISHVSHDMSRGWMLDNPELAGKALHDFFAKYEPELWTLTITRANLPGMWITLHAKRKA